MIIDLIIMLIEWIISLFCIFCTLPLLSQCDPTKKDVKNVFTDIFKDYDKRIKPRQNLSDVVDVKFSFSLVSITDFQEKSQKFSVYGFFEVRWKDEFLVWDPSDYRGLKNISVLQNTVWRPELSAINTMSRLNLIGDSNLPVVILNDGTMRWFAGELFSVLCKIHIKYYPFDRQVCDLIVGVWGYGVEDVTFSTLNDKVTFEWYEPHGEWTIVDTCLTIDNWGDTPLLRLKFFMKRLPDFTVITFLIPIILLSFLNVTVFLTPISTGGKTGFAMTVYLTFAVFLGSASARLPPNSHETSILTAYLTTLVVLCTFNVLISAAQTRVYNHYKNEDIPRFLHFFAKRKHLLAIFNIKRRKGSYTIDDNNMEEKPVNNNVSENPIHIESSADTGEISWDDVMGGIDTCLFYVFISVLIIVTLACFTTLAFASQDWLLET